MPPPITCITKQQQLITILIYNINIMTIAVLWLYQSYIKKRHHENIGTGHGYEGPGEYIIYTYDGKTHYEERQQSTE